MNFTEKKNEKDESIHIIIFLKKSNLIGSIILYLNTSTKVASNMYRAKFNKNTGKINKPII